MVENPNIKKNPSIFEFKIEILKMEMGFIEEHVRHLDILINRNKHMTLFIWVALMSYASTTRNPLIFLLSSFILLPFWYIEAKYKRYSEGWQSRRWAIQEFIQRERFKIKEEITVDLNKCFSDQDLSSFPTPDYFGKDTINKNRHKKLTSLKNNFLKKSMIMYYLPLIILPFLLCIISHLFVVPSTPSP